jgi:hypothetical protein
MVSDAMETPDVIGWHATIKKGGKDIAYGTILIECKASRSDFLADKKKAFRRNANYGMGDYRFFLAPRGIITVQDLPDGWGLLEASPSGRIKIIAEGSRFEANKPNEITLLISAVRRLRPTTGEHASCRVYEIQNKNTASLTYTTPENDIEASQ